MTKFFVFDTNTLISAMFKNCSNPALALKLARTSGTLLISDEISDEYLDIFSREKFDKWLSLETKINFIENIITNALPIQVIEQVSVCREPKGR